MTPTETVSPLTIGGIRHDAHQLKVEKQNHFTGAHHRAHTVTKQVRSASCLLAERPAELSFIWRDFCAFICPVRQAAPAPPSPRPRWPPRWPKHAQLITLRRSGSLL